MTVNVLAGWQEFLILSGPFNGFKVKKSNFMLKFYKEQNFSGKILTGLFIVFFSLSNLISQAHAARIKDITDIKGVRTNQLVGYGLVVGLDGTGDGKKSKFTIQSMSGMLEKMGVSVSAKDIAVKNVAAVMLTAVLPPFAGIGTKQDVLVSSIGDAENLQGGTLLLTPLKGVDGKVYAVAQGPVNTGGFSAGGSGGSIQKNFPTVGRVINGAMIERELNFDFNGKKILTLSLHKPDFTTISRLANVINNQFFGQPASALDSGTVKVRVPEKYIGNLTSLVALIERLDVVPDISAKVIINERTGTVVMGENVRISTIAIAHGNLSIMIKNSSEVSQPNPFAQGETMVTSDKEILVTEESNQLVLVEPGVNIGDVVKALNALGVSPRDLIAIFQAIKAAGALQAGFEVI